MEEPKPSETEKKPQDPVEDPNLNPDPKESGKAVNGDGERGGVAVGSESEADQSTSRSPSGSKKSVRWSPELVSESTYNSTSSDGSNPYVTSSPANSSSAASSSSFSLKGAYLRVEYVFSIICVCIRVCVNVLDFLYTETVSSVRNVLGRWGKSVGETTKEAEDLARNTWQHCELRFLFRLLLWSYSDYGMNLIWLNLDFLDFKCPVSICVN